MCQNNTCGCNQNGRIVVTPTDCNCQKINIVGKSPIKVRTYMVGDVLTYEISLFNPVAPTVTLTVSPLIIEYNTPTTLTFNGTYTKGSSELVSKTITPSPTVVPDLGVSPFSFTVNATATQISDTFLHTFQVIDEDNQSASASAQVTAQYRYYTGFVSVSDNIVTESKVNLFESKLGNNLTDAYGTSRTYINSSTEASHVVWLKPTPTPDMGQAHTPNNASMTVLKEPYKITLNGIQYDVFRTYDTVNAGNTITLAF